MILTSFCALLFICAISAGVIGALTGLGGGVIIIPTLVLLFHVDLHLAMGASLVSILATSAGAARANQRQGYTNFRLGIFLEAPTAFAALSGALLVSYVPKSLLALLLSFILMWSAYLSMRRRETKNIPLTAHRWANKYHLNSFYLLNDQSTKVIYQIQRLPLGLWLMSCAGFLSGLLGIGSGSLKVLALDQVLRLPYKVATATSNFMIGLTACASLGIYAERGYVNPVIAFPVMLGVLLGSWLGARLLRVLAAKKLRLLFSIVIFLIGVQLLIETSRGYF